MKLSLEGKYRVVAACCALALGMGCTAATSPAERYSSLSQINQQTVRNLRLAWRYDMPGSGDPETSPLIVAGTLYAYTPELQVIALDAATGVRKWQFDPQLRDPVRVAA